MQSLPAWERGLKRKLESHISVKFIVAPRVGAWVETKYRCWSEVIVSVAPRVGAWVETAPVAGFRPFT